MRPSKLVFLVLIALLGFNLTGSAQQSLSISDATAQGLSSVTMNITMDADDPVQAYVLAIGYDEGLATATGLEPQGAAASAELQAPEILTGGVTLGVVMDVEDVAAQVLAAIDNNRLYILPHEESRPFIQRRFQRIEDAFLD